MKSICPERVVSQAHLESGRTAPLCELLIRASVSERGSPESKPLRNWTESSRSNSGLGNELTSQLGFHAWPVLFFQRAKIIFLWKSKGLFWLQRWIHFLSRSLFFCWWWVVFVFVFCFRTPSLPPAPFKSLFLTLRITPEPRRASEKEKIEKEEREREEGNRSYGGKPGVGWGVGVAPIAEPWGAHWLRQNPWGSRAGGTGWTGALKPKRQKQFPKQGPQLPRK